ncbi:glycosyltransferase family 4 protein [Patescibacteria group bacterium]
MVIGIDIRFLAEGKRTGVEEYTLHLLHNLFKVGGQHTFKLFANYWHGDAKFISQLGVYPNVTIYRFRYPNKLLNLSFTYLHTPQIDKLVGGCEVFFYPNIIFGEVSPECPVVTTFHDLSFELHPEFLSAKKRIWHQIVNPRRCAEKSTKIIAVSHSTKKDLIATYDLPPGKIKVIHSGLLPQPPDLEEKAEQVRQKYDLPENFVLFFGTLEPRKNVLGALRAFEYLRKNGKINQQLVIAGSPGWLDKSFWQAVSKSPCRSEIRHLGFIEQADKLALLSLADVFLFPSFYEGFGFPSLEAMSVGTPVVTSAVSSLPEVVGGAAILVNPYNVREIATAVEKILTEPELYSQLIRRGWQRVRQFIWSRTASETLQILIEAGHKIKTT